jgi:hypothetical protein
MSYAQMHETRRARGTFVLFVLVFSLFAFALGSSPVKAAPGDVNVCGPLNAYQPASGAQNAVLSIKTDAGLVNYQLVGTGRIPSDLGKDAATSEVLRLTGRAAEGATTVSDYTVTRVASCLTLPSTSTAGAVIEPLDAVILLAVSLLVAVSLVLIRRHA